VRSVATSGAFKATFRTYIGIDQASTLIAAPYNYFSTIGTPKGSSSLKGRYGFAARWTYR